VSNPPFGARVRVLAYYSRAGASSAGRKIRKQWHTWKYGTPREGLYIGKRTLSNGHVGYVGEDDDYVYTADEYFTAALVVFNEHTRPVLVPLDALEVLP
jgi:hypothetical protein